MEFYILCFVEKTVRLENNLENSHQAYEIIKIIMLNNVHMFGKESL